MLMIVISTISGVNLGDDSDFLSLRLLRVFKWGAKSKDQQAEGIYNELQKTMLLAGAQKHWFQRDWSSSL